MRLKISQLDTFNISLNLKIRLSHFLCLYKQGEFFQKKTQACEPLIPDSVVLFETVVTLEESVVIVLELAQIEHRAETHQP
jgi:hypothetical protein